MAYSGVGLTLNQALPEGQMLTQVGVDSAAVLTGPDSAAVAAAVATLVADGATPTQAHVTTLSGAWTTALANSLLKGDAVLLFNPATVLTRTTLRRIFDRFLDLAKGGLGGLTP